VWRRRNGTRVGIGEAGSESIALAVRESGDEAGAGLGDVPCPTYWTFRKATFSEHCSIR
jgi:hypothetical protein